MMACSYLSATGMNPEPSSTACWTPPAFPSALLPEPEVLSNSRAPPINSRPLEMLGLQGATLPHSSGLSQEPALDLTISAPPTESRRQCPSSDDET